MKCNKIILELLLQSTITIHYKEIRNIEKILTASHIEIKMTSLLKSPLFQFAVTSRSTCFYIAVNVVCNPEVTANTLYLLLNRSSI